MIKKISVEIWCLRGERMGMENFEETDDKGTERILEAIAVGDSLGLPWEGLKPRQDKTDWRQCFLGIWGMTSDDAQHAELTATAIREANGNPEVFRSVLGKKLACWFICLPPGIGLATLRACVKLCLGMRAPKSGGRELPDAKAPLCARVCSDN